MAAMFSKLTIFRAAAASLSGYLLLGAAVGAGANAQTVRPETPFNALAGSWTGGGLIRLQDGSSERLSCRALYNPKESGASLGLSIRCASPSYKIELRSSLRYDAGRVSGTWEERTFNANGDVSGKAASGTMQLAFSGNVTGSMSVSYGGSSQRVSLTTSGSGLAGISLNLSKG